MSLLNNVSFAEVDTRNVSEHGVYCIKNKKAPGYQAKLDWFKKKKNGGIKIVIAYDDTTGKQLGFIEYLPSESSWRPIDAKDYFFIQCIALFGKGYRSSGIASRFVEICVENARAQGKSGVCTMTSDGPWMATRKLFEKNGFEVADRLDRFELMYKPLGDNGGKPVFVDWRKQLRKYSGWHLIYSDQCPWHEKAVEALCESSAEHGIKLKIKKINTPKQAQRAPSGFGTFSLVRDGRLLADHYISKTRFENILKKEFAQQEGRKHRE